MIKKCLLFCLCLSIITAVVISLAVLSDIAISHTVRYIATYEDVMQVREFQKAEEYSRKLLNVTEDVIQEKELLREELRGVQALAHNLTDRVELKENVIADYCQTTQDLSMTNRNLLIQERKLTSLLVWTIDKLEGEEQKKARQRYDSIME